MPRYRKDIDKAGQMACLSVSQRRKFSCSCQTRSKNSASSRPLTTSTETRSRTCRSSSTGRTRSAPASLRVSRAISLEGDETTTDSRRSEKEVKREQRTQKHRLPVGRRCFFQPSPRGDGQGTQSRTGKSVISAAGAAPRDSKTKKRAWKDPSMHVSGQMGFPGLALRRVSCAGRGPGSGCAAARGRGPGAGCRRHSPGRGSAVGCAGRRLRLP